MREQIIDLLADHHDASLWSAEYREALADAIMAIVRSSDLAWQCSVDTTVKLKDWQATMTERMQKPISGEIYALLAARYRGFGDAVEILGLLPAVEKESPATVVDSSD